MAVKLLRVRKDGWWEFKETIFDLEPFRTYGSLKATRREPDWRLTGWDLGRLPVEFYESVNRASYIVWSYGTPIAWWVPGSVDHGWIMPDVRYSTSTSAHQNKIRTCFHESGYYTDPDMKEFVAPW